MKRFTIIAVSLFVFFLMANSSLSSACYEPYFNKVRYGTYYGVQFTPTANLSANSVAFNSWAVATNYGFQFELVHYDIFFATNVGIAQFVNSLDPYRRNTGWVTAEDARINKERIISRDNILNYGFTYGYSVKNAGIYQIHFVGGIDFYQSLNILNKIPKILPNSTSMPNKFYYADGREELIYSNSVIRQNKKFSATLNWGLQFDYKVGKHYTICSQARWVSGISPVLSSTANIAHLNKNNTGIIEHEKTIEGVSTNSGVRLNICVKYSPQI